MSKSSSEFNEGTYRLVGDYKIPNLTLPAEVTEIRFGKWGMLHKDYLIHHKKVLFTIMLTQGTLWTYLAEIDEQASAMFSQLVEQMKTNKGITEQLKEEIPMEWIVRMNSIEARAVEIVNNQLIFKA